MIIYQKYSCHQCYLSIKKENVMCDSIDFYPLNLFMIAINFK